MIFTSSARWNTECVVTDWYGRYLEDRIHLMHKTGSAEITAA
ncbi:MAG: hypothetical protein QGI68_08045 [Pseudomonadales bacterium]|nr:hypothetical protein [Pseudomonadales bacterium]MDP7357422.1 hypothetical protein [Pseudomonadales bacterium]MDP7595506.1 hypothetical protein [Pseudomonadales bacterium]HJN52458.1 hypothetical protein [Pseudomonadales bacterium]